MLKKNLIIIMLEKLGRVSEEIDASSGKLVDLEKKYVG